MILQAIEISITIVGDGVSKNFEIDLKNLPPNLASKLPPVPPALLDGTSQLIGPDGAVPAAIALQVHGRFVTVQSTEALKAPGKNFLRYTLNLILLFPTG